VELALWRDIAVVWLALLCFIGMLVPLAAAFFAVKGMHFLVDRTPRLLIKAQGYSRIMRQQTDTASRTVAAPVIAAQRQATRWSTFAARLTGRQPSRRR
jgi:hypothetical protein